MRGGKKANIAAMKRELSKAEENIVSIETILAPSAPAALGIGGTSTSNVDWRSPMEQRLRARKSVNAAVFAKPCQELFSVGEGDYLGAPMSVSPFKVI